MRHLVALGIILWLGLTQISRPDVSWIPKNWGLIAIRASLAWTASKNKKTVIVAVIDTGVDARHPALAGRVSKFGWDFITNRGLVVDTHGHGTHIAGIITAVSDSRALIVPLKFYDEAAPGSLNLRNTVKAIDFAVDHGARIINYSGGGADFSEKEYEALKRAEKAGVLIVAAAGNESQDVDLPKNFYYPSGYALSNIISVMSTDSKNEPLASSNWGQTKVDVAAPGENIYSTLPNGHFGFMTGTSQATAFVTGIATMLLSENPKLTPSQIKTLICKSVDSFSQLKSKSRCGGRVNAHTTILNAKTFTTVKK